MWGWLALQSALGVLAALCFVSRRARHLIAKGHWLPMGAGYIAVLAWLMFYEIQLPANLYTEFGVAPSASVAQVAVRYNSILRHTPQTDNQVIKLKQIHKLLGHAQYRRAYNRYGDLLTESDLRDGDGSTDAMIARLFGKEQNDDSGIFIVFKLLSLSLATALFCWSLSTLATTFHPKFNFARQIMTFYLAAQFFLELHLRHMEDPVLLASSSFSWLPYFNQLLPFEKVQILRQIFPVVLSISMCISALTFVDTDQINLYFASAILQTNRAILMNLEGSERQAEVAALSGNPSAIAAAHRRHAAQHKPSTATAAAADGGGEAPRQ